MHYTAQFWRFLCSKVSFSSEILPRKSDFPVLTFRSLYKSALLDLYDYRQRSRIGKNVPKLCQKNLILCNNIENINNFKEEKIPLIKVSSRRKFSYNTFY